MMLIVPVAAYRSLESEIDDGTLELLSITTLSPWQIVLGKLGSASLQMLLYFVTLFPCLAYAYSLRGVDLPTTLLIVSVLAVAGMLLTVVGLFFAPLAQGRSGRIASLLVLLLLLVGAEFGVSSLVAEWIFYGNPLSRPLMLCIIFSTLLLSLAVGHLLLTATAAQLTPETENRSTPIRISLLALTAVAIFVIALVMSVMGSEGLGLYAVGVILVFVIWAFCGSMIVAERSTVTARIRRELPSSFMARLFLTWLTPGPTTGLVFCLIGIGILTVMQQFALDWILRNGIAAGVVRGQMRTVFGEIGLLFPAYLACFLVAIRLIVMVVRLRNNPRVQIGLAAMIVVAVLSALVPYSLQLHYNDYQPLTYDPTWQVTNWAFTMMASLERTLPAGQVEKVVGAAIGLSLLAIFYSWETTRPRRIATPKRVKEELAQAV